MIEVGRIDLAVLDQAVLHVLTLKFRLRLFETPFVDSSHAAQAFHQHEQFSPVRKIAEQYIVLLKNDGNLTPLRPNLASLAVIGQNAGTICHLVGDYSDGSFSSMLEGGELAPE